MIHRLLHLSDTHFGTERPVVCEAARDLAFELAPDLIVLSGDITQRATPWQFERAQAFLRGLPPVPVLTVPGNHDVPMYALPMRMLTPYRRYRSYMGPSLEPSFDEGPWHVSCVNTSRWWRHHQGAISRAQVARVRARLASAPADAWRIVVTHHPMRVKQASDVGDVPWGHARALASWVDAGVHLLLGGHTHDPFAAPLWQCSGSAAATASPWVVQAGTAVSSRVRHGVPNSVMVLEQVLPQAGPRVRRVVRWDFDARRRRFVPMQVTSMA